MIDLRNTDASRIAANQATSISYVCRDNTDRILRIEEKNVGDSSVFVAETLAIHKALNFVIKKNLSNVIIESNSLIVIQAIDGETRSRPQICDMVKNIIILVRAVDKIKFCTAISLSMNWWIR